MVQVINTLDIMMLDKQSITTAGQFIIRFIEKKVNEYLNNILKTHDEVDYIVASDTDSIYVRFGKLVEKLVKVKQ